MYTTISGQSLDLLFIVISDSYAVSGGRQHEKLFCFSAVAL